MAETPTSAPASKGVLAGVCLAVAALLFPFLRPLSVEWEINPQYSYGWGALALTAYLFWKRWEDRPAPVPPASRRLQGLAVGGLMAAMLPLLLVQEANPDWRPLMWLMGAIELSVGLLVLWASGGRPWASHFLFPLAFFLIAIPWPSPVEDRAVQGLMRLVADVTVEAVNWFGVPALRKGNLIEVPGGVVGVSEACSGVRSFQGTLMASLFFGELGRFSLSHRVAVAGFGVALSLVLNTIRTFTLAWIHIQSGAKALDRWHDPAGYVVLGAAFVGLGGFSWWLQRRRPLAPPASCDTQVRPAAWVPPMALSIVFAGVVAIFLAVVEGYYRSAESGLVENRRWQLKWPATGAGFEPTSIEDETRNLLRVSDADSGVWRRPHGTQWFLFQLRWDPGRTAANLARLHSPELCLPASGLKLLKPGPEAVVDVGGLKLPFRTWLFDYQGRPMHVFFCVWDTRVRSNAQQVRVDDISRRGRLRAVLERRRHPGQQVLEVAILGLDSMELARRELQAGLSELVHGVDTQPSSKTR